MKGTETRIDPTKLDGMAALFLTDARAALARAAGETSPPGMRDRFPEYIRIDVAAHVMATVLARVLAKHVEDVVIARVNNQRREFSMWETVKRTWAKMPAFGRAFVALCFFGIVGGVAIGMIAESWALVGVGIGMATWVGIAIRKGRIP